MGDRGLLMVDGEELPDGWRWVRLEDVSELISGQHILASDYNVSGEGIGYLTGPSDFGSEHPVVSKWTEHPKRTALLGDILITVKGSGVGKINRLDIDEVAISRQLVALRPNAADSDYIYAFLSLHFDYFQELANGAAIPGLSRQDILSFRVPLPPLPEQRRIVAILDDVFEGIDRAIANTERNLANARELFESYLNRVFTEKGEGWVERELGDVLSAQPRNGWSPPARHHSESGTPVLTLSSVTGFTFKGDSVKYTSAPVDPQRHYWVRNGDLLITRSNTPALVGHVAIADGIEEATIYPDLIMRMRTDESVVVTEFIYYQLRTARLRKVISDRAQGANPTMKKINKRAVQTLPIVVCSLHEQMHIVTGLRAVQSEVANLESLYTRKLAALAELKQSILRKAFSGELTGAGDQTSEVLKTSEV